MVHIERGFGYSPDVIVYIKPQRGIGNPPMTGRFLFPDDFVWGAATSAYQIEVKENAGYSQVALVLDYEGLLQYL